MPGKFKQSREEAHPKDERTRNWTFVIYPIDGSPPAPSNWREILDEQHLQWIESPLHEKDLNPDNTPKKPHIHILILYDGKKSFEQVKEITDSLNAPIPQKCANTTGLVRYFAHIDNPEKVQYDRNKIIGHGGADPAEYLKTTSGHRYQLIGEMFEYIESNDIQEYSDLALYAMRERFDDWFPLLADNSTMILNTYICSRRNKIKLIEAKKQEDEINKSNQLLIDKILKN